MDELDLSAVDLKKVTKTKRQECEDLIAEIQKLRDERDEKAKEVSDQQVETLVAPIENADVNNVKYGAGRVVSCDGHYLVVEFNQVQKKFQFPNAFLQGFLTVDDPSLEKEFTRVREEEKARNTLKQELEELKREIMRSEMKLMSYIR